MSQGFDGYERQDCETSVVALDGEQKKQKGPDLVIVKSSIMEGQCMDDKVIASKLSKECEALAVSGSVEYKDEIDVIGPGKILKQLFDTPNLKEDLISIAVQLVGQILVLYSWEQVTPLTWLDNEMPSVHELAICYHQNGVVQGHVHGKPHIFQQNGLSLLRFLQSECKNDPGAYWLYKSAGEDEIQFFDLNHSSSPLPSLIYSERKDSLFSLGNLLYRLGHRLSLSEVPNDRNNCVRFLRKCLNFLKEPDHLVVRAYAHEQFATLILNEAGSDTSSAPAPLFQTTSNLILSNLAAVDHVSQAIMYLSWTRQLESPEQEDASHDILPCVDLSKCACGDPDCIVVCDIHKCLLIDRKLWKLVRLLGESHLSLGKAYGENGQLHQALDAVKSACFLYGSMPQKFEETLSQVEDLEAIGEIPSRCLFWAKVWNLVGGIYCQFYSFKCLESSDTQKLTSINHLNLPSEVVEEVDRLTKKLTEYSQNCASCSLVNCSCKSDIPSSGSSASSSSSSSGIFKYLTGPTADDSESNLLAALNCYEEARRVLQQLPSCLNCDVLKELTANEGWIFNNLGEDRMSRKEIDKAEDAFADALAAYKEICEHTNAITISRNMGYWRRKRAVETVRNMEALKLLPHRSTYQAALELAKLEYNKSLSFYVAAKKASDEASSLPDNLKEVIYKDLANTYLRFGRLLAKEETTSAANKYLRKGMDLYESLGELHKEVAAFVGLDLARFLRACCLRSLETDNITKAHKYSLLANTYYQKSMDICGPENSPSIFLKILIERSNLSLSVSNYWDLNNMLESALNVLLQGRHIPQVDAESLSTEDQNRLRTQMQKVLKKMVTEAKKSENVGRVFEKLKNLYAISLRSTSLSDLDQMHVLWTSP